MKFKVIFLLRDVAVHNKLTDAMVDLFKRVREQLAVGMSWQALETTNFVVLLMGDGEELPMEFYDVRDFACEIGVLVDGEIVESAPEPHPELVLFKFNTLNAKYMLSMIERTIAHEELQQDESTPGL